MLETTSHGVTVGEWASLCTSSRVNEQDLSLLKTVKFLFLLLLNLCEAGSSVLANSSLLVAPPVAPLRNILVNIAYKHHSRHLSLLVVPTDGPSLFGYDWLNAISLDWKQLSYVHSSQQKELCDLLEQYSTLFHDKWEP